MTFAQRLKLYLFGFLIGLLILMVILKGKKCSGPNTLKVEELSAQHLQMSEQIRCQLQCIHWNDTILKKEMLLCTVDYDKSEVQAKPFGKYTLISGSKNKYPIQLLIEDRDTITYISQLNGLALDTSCHCP